MTPPPGEAPSQMAPFAIPLTDEANQVLSFQRYDAPSLISGVNLSPMRKNRAENGWFAEVFRLEAGVSTAPLAGLEVRQVSAAYAEPFRINAFHIHPRVQQDEAWVVLRGALTVWLIDCRRDSPTVDVRMRVQLSAEEPAMLFIPAGVAHGYRAGPEGGLLLYGMNQQFDLNDPNEGRLPWDFFGAEIWDEERG